MSLLSTLFWAFFASYVVHVLDETLLNGGFVRWIADNFWPSYNVRMFFWFNAAFIGAIVSIKFLVRWFHTRTLTPFAWYCGIFGAFCIVRFA